MTKEPARGQLLHLVFGGELTDLDGTEFKDLDSLDIVGIYPNYAEAFAAWMRSCCRMPISITSTAYRPCSTASQSGR